MLFGVWVCVVSVVSADVFHTPSFDTTWSGGMLTVTSRATNTVVWETTEAAWLQVNHGVFTSKQDAGDFAVSLQIKSSCTAPVIATAWADHSGVHFNGTICNGKPFHMWLRETATRFLQMTVTLIPEAPPLSADAVSVVTLSYGCDAEDHMFGLGSQFTHLDLKGRRVPVFVQEQGVGRGLQPLTSLMNRISAGGGGTWYTTYGYSGFYLTSTVKGRAVLSDAYYEVDFTQLTTTRVHVVGDSLDFAIVDATSPLGLVETYTQYSGRMREPPAWVDEGAILGLENGTDLVRHVMSMVQSVTPEFPIAAVWIQDWTGERVYAGRVALWWTWQLDPILYHDWSQLVQGLRAKGVRMTTYINSMMMEVNSPTAPRDLHREALQQGFLVNTSTGTWSGYGAGLLDLTNAAARAWYKGIMCDGLFNKSGAASGWMADFGEAIPMDARLASGGEPMEAHMQYPLLWQQLNAEVIRDCDTHHDAVFWSRSFTPKSPPVLPLVWLGDQLESWDNDDGLASAITGMQTIGLSGFSNVHFDVGGYTVVNALSYTRTKELLLRSAEAAAFSPLFRSHPGSDPRPDWQPYSDAETLRGFARMARVFVAWRPYRRSLMLSHTKTGAPIIRPLVMHYVNDTSTYSLRTQYMIGDQFIVAPVVTKGATQRKAYLPRGTYTYLWTGDTITVPVGKWTTVEAPVGCPPVWYMSGSPQGTALRTTLEQADLLSPCNSTR